MSNFYFFPRPYIIEILIFVILKIIKPCDFFIVVAGNDSTDFTDGRARSRCCSVPGCKNRNGQMHTFPKNNPQRVQRWLQAINVDISSYKINSYRRVCHLHFPPESYARNLQAELLNYPCRKRLAEDAVPSLLLPPPPAEGINPPVPKLKLVEDMICQQPDSSGSKRYACCIPKCSNRNGTMHSFPSDQGKGLDFSLNPPPPQYIEID